MKCAQKEEKNKMVKILKIEPLNRSFALRTYESVGCEQCGMLACITLVLVYIRLYKILCHLGASSLCKMLHVTIIKSFFDRNCLEK